MEHQGSEISLKIRSAIKAKLVELGAYVDEELPDYVMVMIANKKSKVQMTDDLQLFLGKHSEAFTGWLHDVLERLQSISSSIVSSIKEEPRSRSNERGRSQKSPPKSSKGHTDAKRKYSRRASSSESSSGSTDEEMRRRQLDRQRSHHREKLTSTGNSRSQRHHRTQPEKSSNKEKRTRRKSNSYESNDGDSYRRHPTTTTTRSSKYTVRPTSDPPITAAAVKDAKPTAVSQRNPDVSAKSDQLEDVLDIHDTGDIEAFSEAYLSDSEVLAAKENVEDKRSHPRIEPPTNVVRPLKRSPIREEVRSQVSKSVVAQVVSRDTIPEDEYDPNRPQIGSVASVVKVSGRKPAVSKELGAKPNLFLKAIKQANDSVVKTKRKSSDKEKPLELYTKKRRTENEARNGRSSKVKEVKPMRVREELRMASPDQHQHRGGERRTAEKKESLRREENQPSSDQSTRPVMLRRSFVPDTRRVESKPDSEPKTDEEMLVVDHYVSTTTRFVVTLTGTGEELKPIAINTRTALVQGVPLTLTARNNGSAFSSPNQSITPDLVIPQAQTLRIDLSDDDEDGMDVSENPLMVGPDDMDMMVSRQIPLVSPQALERCRFFPGCRLGDKCPFFHPSIPCKAFPNCTFGDKCRFLHPSCRFDSNCRNPNCPFNHSSCPKSSYPSFNTKPSVMCRFGGSCKNPSCQYRHSKPCMYGDSCKRVGCTFTHPKQPFLKKTDAAKFRWTATNSGTSTVQPTAQTV